MQVVPTQDSVFVALANKDNFPTLKNVRKYPNYDTIQFTDLDEKYRANIEFKEGGVVEMRVYSDPDIYVGEIIDTYFNTLTLVGSIYHFWSKSFSYFEEVGIKVQQMRYFAKTFHPENEDITLKIFAKNFGENAK